MPSRLVCSNRADGKIIRMRKRRHFFWSRHLVHLKPRSKSKLPYSRNNHTPWLFSDTFKMILALVIAAVAASALSSCNAIRTRASVARFLAIGYIYSALAQDASPSPVPTGVPVAANYTGSLRPQVHFSVPQNFMNDPNGLFRAADGTWHLYYQCLC